MITHDYDLQYTNRNADDKAGKKNKKGKAAQPALVRSPPDITPCEIRLWASAAENATRSAVSIVGNQGPQTYAFPPPSMFQGGRYKTYILNWLHMRGGWIDRMTRGNVGTIALKVQSWKTLLWFGYTGPNPKPLGDCRELKADLDQYNITVNANGTLTCRDGTRLSTPVPAYPSDAFQTTVNLVAEAGQADLRKLTTEQYNVLCQDVLCELQELNYRLDLKRLDELLWKGDNTDGQQWARYNEVVKCWQDGKANRWCEVTGDQRNNAGLAADCIRERLPFLRALFALCEEWRSIDLPLPLKRLSDTCDAIADNDAETLEVMLVNALMRCACIHLHRPMLAPGRARPVAERS